MSSRSERARAARAGAGAGLVIIVAAVVSAVGTTRARPPRPLLRVCADPNNLPFSNDRGEGFENKIATLVARDLGAQLRYTWWAQRRGFLRHTMGAGQCDVLIGAPARYEGVLVTAPYYRSAYAFVTRKDRALDVRSFDDPVLRRLRIGVQLIGDDYANTPPAHALSRRGIVSNVSGYMVYGDYARSAKPSAIVEAVSRGDVDVAVVWGPLAGYFARLSPVPLDVVPVAAAVDPPALPLAFDMSMAVRPGDTALRARLDDVLRRHRREIDAILTAYAVPRVTGEVG